MQGIPTLVLVDGCTGDLLTADGRSVVMDDTEGADFPWKPKSFTEMVAEGKLVNQEGEETSWSALEEEYIGIYFSAHWVSVP